MSSSWTHQSNARSPARRLLLQYLEPSASVDQAAPDQLRDRLAHAFAWLPVTDLALGWRLREEVIEAVLGVVPAQVTLWRWVPVFVDSGSGRAVDRQVALGVDGRAPRPFRDMADFRFLCLDRDDVVAAGLERSINLAREIGAAGVLLDRIRWHSPSRSPASELTCFCAQSRASAARDGLDLDGVQAAVLAASGTLAGRRMLVAALLGMNTGVFGDFLAWRTSSVDDAVARLSEGLAEVGLRAALDVFTPALAHSVGQDLAALGAAGEWSKSMTYLEAEGPASLPFELRGYVHWLEEAGDSDAAGYLGDVLGIEAPGLTASGPQLPALQAEAERLSSAIGPSRSIIGIDAVEIATLCEVNEADLVERVQLLRAMDLGMCPSWDLLFMSRERIRSIADSWRA